MAKAPERPRGVPPRKLAVTAIQPSPSPAVCAVENAGTSAPSEMKRELARPAIEPEIVAVPAPPPPPSSSSPRMPSRAAVVVGGSFSLSPTTPMPVQPSARPVAVLGPASHPHVPASAPKMYAGPGSLPPARPPEPSYTPPPMSAPVPYERAFRGWSQPSFEVRSDVLSTEPPTYQVFTTQALALRPRRPSQVCKEPLSPTQLFARAAAVIVGIAMVVATGIVGLMVAGEDAPSRAAAVDAPPAVVTTTSALDPAPTTVVAPTVVAPPFAPAVVVDPAPAPAPPPPVPVKVAPKKPAAPAKDRAAVPPNPYGG